ncbi:MAG: tRNA (adenosine(37)-N6)-dimethylallyltransferase MiaA [Bacteroidales bacterium]|nr:tRNA (adenosine(37)-N6)-dimethylallyltransferase MiaA [Bacteroidales bacterium]
MVNNIMLTVLGPTATGKTSFAAHLACYLNGEVISADSRQVYRGMDMATGKDLKDYIVNGETIPHHLIDIVDPGYEYNVYEFQHDFLKTYENIITRGKLPVLCGGTGMYIESVLKGYKLINVPENPKLRSELEENSKEELVKLLKSFKTPHNITDIKDRKRLVRAIEIQHYYNDHPEIDTSFPEIKNTIFGLRFERQIIRERITERLKKRLNEGMVDEVKNLLDRGLKPEQLKFYGLEYKYLTQYVTGEISYREMFRLLNTAINQFAKRQMTWFRKMEKEGHKINWIDGNLSMKEKIKSALEIIKNKTL